MVTDINGCQHSTAWALAMTKLKSAVQQRKSPVARDLIHHGRVEPYHDAANLYLGDAWTVDAPRDGIHSAVEFITRGLMYALNRAPLPSEYEIVINRMPWLTMQREHDLAYEQGYGAIIVGNQPQPEFMGLFTKLPDDRYATRWIMTIYMNVAFEVYTASRDLLSQARSKDES